jgi:hypothetical protein
MDSDGDTACAVGCPIRRSRDQRSLASPPGFSQRATSFIASQCQGIHQMPFSSRLSTTPNSKSHTSSHEKTGPRRRCGNSPLKTHIGHNPAPRRLARSGTACAMQKRGPGRAPPDVSASVTSQLASSPCQSADPRPDLSKPKATNNFFLPSRCAERAGFPQPASTRWWR